MFLTRSSCNRGVIENYTWAGVSVEADNQQFSPTIEPQMTLKSPGINP